MYRSSRRASTLAWTMLLALLIPILVACGGTTPAVTSDAPAASVETEASEPAASTEAEESAPAEESAAAEESAPAEESAAASAEASEGAEAPATGEGAQSPINDKVIIFGTEQEPETFFGYESSALATSEVLSPLGRCATALSYEYQPTYCFDEFPTFENGGAVTETATIDASAISVDNPIVVDGEVITDTAAAEEAGIEIPSELPQLTLTWTLADDLFWDDGTPVTSADYLEAARISRDPETLRPTRYIEDRTISVEGPDDKTVVQVMAPGYLDSTYFVDTFYGFAPSHLYADQPVSEVRDAESARPTSFGPFMFQEHEPGVQTTLVSNPYFATQPKVGTLIFKYVADSNQLLAQLETGEIDIPSPTALTLGFVPQLDDLEAAGNIAVEYVAGTTWEHMDFGIERGDGEPSFFDDVRTRQAVAYAINRGQIIDDVQFGKTTVMNTIVPSNHPAYPGDDALEPYEYDPDRAAELFEEAGWTLNADGRREKDGRVMEMTFYTTQGNPTRQAVAEIIQQNLDQVGMTVNLEFVPAAEKFFKQGSDGILTPRLFDLGMYAWLSGNEPGFALYYCTEVPTPENSFGGQNYPGYCNEEYEQKARAALQILDADERNAASAEPLIILNRDLPTFPLYQRLKIGAVKQGVTGVVVDPTEVNSTYNTEEWDIVVE